MKPSMISSTTIKCLISSTSDIRNPKRTNYIKKTSQIFKLLLKYLVRNQHFGVCLCKPIDWVSDSLFWLRSWSHWLWDKALHQALSMPQWGISLKILSLCPSPHWHMLFLSLSYILSLWNQSINQPISQSIFKNQHFSFVFIWYQANENSPFSI